jgi:hypothetical protein
MTTNNITSCSVHNYISMHHPYLLVSYCGKSDSRHCIVLEAGCLMSCTCRLPSQPALIVTSLNSFEHNNEPSESSATPVNAINGQDRLGN